MGKKGYDPHEKQSSTMSNRQVIDLLKEYGFAVGKVSPPVEAKKSVRAAVADAKKLLGEFAHISQTGESAFFVGKNVNAGEPAHVRVKLSNMLGLGEKDALYKLTGIPELAPKRK